MIYSFKIRLLTIVGLVAVSLVIAFGRSFQLQVLEGAHLEKLAQSQQQRTVVLEPKGEESPTGMDASWPYRFRSSPFTPTQRNLNRPSKRLGSLPHGSDFPITN